VARSRACGAFAPAWTSACTETLLTGTLIAILAGMLGLSRKSLAFLLLFVGLCGCSSGQQFTPDMATADVSGVYMVALTNDASSCPFPNWMEGKTASGVSLTITQDGAKLHGTIDDAATALVFTLAFGSTNFDGTVSGNDLTLVNYGSRNQRMGNCSFTYNATADGMLDGDSISGTITYAPATNDNPDCATVQCSASQRFSGSRPPK